MPHFFFLDIGINWQFPPGQSWQGTWVTKRLLLRGVYWSGSSIPVSALPLCVCWYLLVCVFLQAGQNCVLFLPPPYLHSCYSASWFLQLKAIFIHMFSASEKPKHSASVAHSLLHSICDSSCVGPVHWYNCFQLQSATFFFCKATSFSKALKKLISSPVSAFWDSICATRVTTSSQKNSDLL